jgi:hypothetical protein
MKKYNIGSPKRVVVGKTKSKTSKTSYKKKYNIGLPAKVVAAPETPDTPRSNIWKKIRQQNAYKYHEISDYEPDEDDEALKDAREPGIPSPTTYTTFEEVITPYMTKALEKKPFTSAMDEVDEEAWKQKPGDSPNKKYPEPMRLIPGKRPRTRTSRTRVRGRSRASRRTIRRGRRGGG